MTESNYRTASLQACIRIKTKHYPGYAYDQAVHVFKTYFENRFFILQKESDYIDAGRWAEFFFENMNKGMELECVTVKDEAGRQAYVDNKSLFSMKFKKLFNPEISTIKAE